jgi:hypothetical protein
VEPGHAASPEVSWDALRDTAIADINALIDDVTATRADLRSYQSVLEKNRRHLERGGRIDETPALFNIQAERIALTERLGSLERTRAAARLALWRLQVAEGATIAEVARVWGFSRQLVSRALANPDADKRSK